VSARRPLFKLLITVASLAALLVPAVVAVATGFIEITFTAWGEQPGPDPTPIEAWVALALAYLVWTPLVLFGLVFALDRLGYKYMPPERDRRPSRKDKRRREAGMRYLQSREAPPAGAPKARPKRGASSSTSRTASRPPFSPPPDTPRDGD